MEREETHYLNTDLILVAPTDLTPLAGALIRQGLLDLYVSPHPDEGLWTAKFEAGEPFREPGLNIVAMLNAIDSLDDQWRSHWEACTIREFNIGYQCGKYPWAFNQQISTATLQRIAAAGGSITITLYPANHPGNNPTGEDGVE